MRIKDNSISLSNLQPQILLGLIIVDQIMQRYLNKYGKPGEAIITSANDARHKKRSLHYSGTGVDVRSRMFDTIIQPKILSECIKALGDDFQFILESNHYHLQWKPTRRDK